MILAVRVNNIKVIRKVILGSCAAVFAFKSRFTMMSVVSALLLLLTVAVTADLNEIGQKSYDIDSSWAIHSSNLADTFGDKQALCT